MQLQTVKTKNGLPCTKNSQKPLKKKEGGKRDLGGRREGTHNKKGAPAETGVPLR